MPDNLKRLFVNLLFLTPLGYLLALFSLVSGESTPGFRVVFKERHWHLEIDKRSVYKKRDFWIINGFSLLTQAFIAMFYFYGNLLAYGYAWLAIAYGIVSLFIVVHPDFRWNSRVPFLGLSVFEFMQIAILFLFILPLMMFRYPYLEYFERVYFIDKINIPL